AGDGSPASIDVRLTNVKISKVGTGKFNADGIRVDERSVGSIQFHSHDSTITEVGADGVELDEGQDGSVIATAVDTEFSDNGIYCDPKVLKPFLPKYDEGKFEDGKTAQSDIPGKVEGSPDDNCFERDVELYDSGYVKEFEIEIDLDDGFDVDEAGNGDLRTVLVRTQIDKNVDEGIDFDEEDAGELDVVVWDSEAKGNTDDGFRAYEEGPGDARLSMYRVKSEDNGRKGATFRQTGQGKIDVVADRTKTKDNGDGDKTGLVVDQRGPDGGSLTVRNSDIADGIDAKGVTVTED
ncbi:MAG: hypothetical protein ACR2QF_00410, partial [Geminicoccaceae bacterium]